MGDSRQISTGVQRRREHASLVPMSKSRMASENVFVSTADLFLGPVPSFGDTCTAVAPAGEFALPPFSFLNRFGIATSRARVARRQCYSNLSADERGVVNRVHGGLIRQRTPELLATKPNIHTQFTRFTRLTRRLSDLRDYHRRHSVRNTLGCHSVRTPHCMGPATGSEAPHHHMWSTDIDCAGVTGQSDREVERNDDATSVLLLQSQAAVPVAACWAFFFHKSLLCAMIFPFFTNERSCPHLSRKASCMTCYW
eukprot:scpid52997/ scgid8942/ 